MDRNALASEVQRNLGYFQRQWQAFCDRVERYAADMELQSRAALLDYEKRAKVDYEALGKKWRSSTKADWERETSGPQKGPLEDVINAAYAEGAPGPNYFWAQREDFAWLNVLTSLNTCFWCKPKVQNLLPWVTLAPASNVHKRQTKKWATPQDRNKYAITLKLTEDEHLLCDCAVLSIVHDNWNLGSGEGRIFSDTAYTGRYFERDKFCRMVWGTSKTEGADGRLERMWDRVKTEQELRLSLGKGAAKIHEEPATTLENFMKDSCRGTVKDSQVTRYKKALFDAARRDNIELPPLARKWKAGQSKYYSIDALRRAWPVYRQQLPQLPNLEPSQPPTE